MEEIVRSKMRIGCDDKQCRLKMDIIIGKSTCSIEVISTEEEDGINAEVVVKGDKECEKLVKEWIKNYNGSSPLFYTYYNKIGP